MSFPPYLRHSCCQAYEQAETQNEPVLERKLKNEADKRQRLGARTTSSNNSVRLSDFSVLVVRRRCFRRRLWRRRHVASGIA